MANRKHLSDDLVEEGNIYDLSNSRLKQLKKGWGEVDLVAGGPPCQGFSGIGHRRSHSVEKRHSIKPPLRGNDSCYTSTPAKSFSFRECARPT